MSASLLFQRFNIESKSFLNSSNNDLLISWNLQLWLSIEFLIGTWKLVLTHLSVSLVLIPAISSNYLIYMNLIKNWKKILFKLIKLNILIILIPSNFYFYWSLITISKKGFKTHKRTPSWFSVITILQNGTMSLKMSIYFPFKKSKVYLFRKKHL